MQTKTAAYVPLTIVTESYTGHLSYVTTSLSLTRVLMQALVSLLCHACLDAQYAFKQILSDELKNDAAISLWQCRWWYQVCACMVAFELYMIVCGGAGDAT